jgi:protein SCO1/2
MKRLATIVAFVLAAASATPATANFSRGQLDAVAAAPPPAATLPLALQFQDETGRSLTLGAAFGGVPGVVIFADYTCHTLCGPILEFVAGGLAKTGLRPGTDYRLIVIGLDPNDGLDAARTMRAKHVGASPLADATLFLSGRADEVHAIATAAGFNYSYDSEHDQFAYPAAAYIVDARGRVRRVLSPLGLGGNDLRLAIVDAGNGAVGSFADRIHLLCYGYDPVRGIYTERITTMLTIAAGATVIALAGGVVLMARRERKRAAS